MPAQNDGLCFAAQSPADSVQMAVMLALGMCVAVRDRLVLPGYACDKLFRPSLVQRLRALGARESLCKGLEEALELEDVAKLAPHGLTPLLDRLIQLLTAYLEDSQQDRVQGLECWVTGPPS